jgi:hypothetical protein
LALFSGDFVNPDVRQIREVLMGQTILDHLVNSCGYGAPGATKKLCYMFPGQ